MAPAVGGVLMGTKSVFFHFFCLYVPVRDSRTDLERGRNAA